MVKPGLFYLEALETPPESRRKGYAAHLISDVIEEMKQEGSFRLCDREIIASNITIQLINCSLDIISKTIF